MPDDLTPILRYFSHFSEGQCEQLAQLPELYQEWNAKINLISRKDIDHLMLHHVLHSLALLKVCPLRDGLRVLDFGTGGGFPGIPLAIAAPNVHFHLIDSVAKKVGVVERVVESLQLPNVTVEQVRGEKVKGEYDLVVSRAVAELSQLWRWAKHLIMRGDAETTRGVIAYKGEPLSKEIAPFGDRAVIYRIDELFEEPYFEGKRLVLVKGLTA